MGDETTTIRFSSQMSKEYKQRTRHTRLLAFTIGRAAGIEQGSPQSQKILYADHGRREVWLGKRIIAYWKKNAEAQEHFIIDKQILTDQAKFLNLGIQADDIIKSFDDAIAS